MATIEISTALANRIATGMLGLGVAGLSYGTTPILNNTSALYLCSGTRPVATPTTSELSTYNLVRWFANTSSFSPTSLSGTTAIINTNANAATATGVATWFCLCVNYSGTIYSAVTGNVGVTGSGADLEISNTTITTGSQYRISQFILTIPTTYNF